MNRLKYLSVIPAILLGVALLGGCTEYNTPAEIQEDANVDTVSIGLSKRVLWINLDGAKSSIVKSAIDQGQLPTLKKMLEHSKYSFSGLSDTREVTSALTDYAEEDPVTWAAMLTGVHSNLHKIGDYSYSPDFSLTTGTADKTVTYFPTIVQYLGSSAPNVSVSVVTPWASLNRYLGDANSIITTSSDDETFSVVDGQLASDDYYFYIVSFKNVLEAGKAGGFSSDNKAYLSALQACDSHVKELLATIENREHHEKEDWLTVITSNHGGNAAGECSGVSDDERDIFGIFHFNHYTPKEMQGEIFSVVSFDCEDPSWSFVPDSTAMYSLTDDEWAFEYTFQNTPKNTGAYNGVNWASVTGKSFWNIHRQRATMSFRVNTSGISGYSAIEVALTTANDMFWHHYFYALDKTDKGGRPYRLSSDGVGGKYSYRENANPPLPKDSSSIVLGSPGMDTDYRVSVLRVWNSVLNDYQITQNSKVPHDFDTANEFSSKLVGEWVLSENRYIPEKDTVNYRSEWQAGRKFYKKEVYGHINNNVPGGPAMYFIKPPTFVKVANTLPYKLESGDIVMENIEIAPQILYWFCGTVGVDSKLCGYPFLKNYTIEENWRDNEIEEEE